MNRYTLMHHILKDWLLRHVPIISCTLEYSTNRTWMYGETACVINMLLHTA